MRNLRFLSTCLASLAVTATAAADPQLAPDPTMAGQSMLYAAPLNHDSWGQFVPRTADLFLQEGAVDYEPTWGPSLLSQRSCWPYTLATLPPDATVPSPVESQSPVSLRALRRYDMRFDPMFDSAEFGYDAEEFVNKLTGPTRDGEAGLRLAECDGCPRVTSAAGDPVLYIDLAAFYDDSEADRGGGFHANFKARVRPVDVREGAPDQEALDAVGEFRTPLRGPFWSGEKLEVGDADESSGGFRPQIMYFENFGIWNWAWSNANAVEVEVIEGDGVFKHRPRKGEENIDTVAKFIVLRRWTEAPEPPVVVSDAGNLVTLEITDQGYFRRTVTECSNRYPDPDSSVRRVTRVFFEYDTHNIDLAFRTRPLPDHFGTRSCQDQSGPVSCVDRSNHRAFADRYVLGPNLLRGENLEADFPWRFGGLLEGEQSLRFVDNVHYTPGWDCPGHRPTHQAWDTDDDFEFLLTPGSSGVHARTARGGCDGKSSLFFRSSEVLLPEPVSVRRTTVQSVANDSSVTLSLARDPTRPGMAFTELLAYWTNGANDFGYHIEKSSGESSYDFQVSTFDGEEGSQVAVRATVLQWPVCLPAYVTSTRLSTAPAHRGFAHQATDLPVPRPAIVGGALGRLAHFVVNEMLVYDPAGDNDMSWELYFEPLSFLKDPLSLDGEDIVSHVNFQLATVSSENAGSFAEAEGHVVQFPVQLGLPVAAIDPEGTHFETSYPDGVLVHLSGLGSRANAETGVTPDSLVSYSWSDDGSLVGTGPQIALQLGFGTHTIGLAVEDECGYVDDASVTVEVAYKEPVCGDAVLDFGEECDDGNADELDGCLSTCQADADADGVADVADLCPDSPFSEVTNADGCAIDQVAPCEGPWADHGEYVSALAQVATSFWQMGLIGAAERGAIVARAAGSACGMGESGG